MYNVMSIFSTRAQCSCTKQHQKPHTHRPFVPNVFCRLRARLEARPDGHSASRTCLAQGRAGIQEPEWQSLEAAGKQILRMW